MSLSSPGVAILFEHSEWFQPLFAELDRPAGFRHAVGDLRNLEINVGLDGDPLQLALAFEACDELVQVFIRHVFALQSQSETANITNRPEQIKAESPAPRLLQFLDAVSATQ